VSRKKTQTWSSALIRNSWEGLSGRHDPLDGQRINVCRPSFIRPSPTQPVRLQFEPRSENEPAFRIHRLKSKHEETRTELFIQLSTDIADLAPQVRAHLLEVEAGRDVGVLASRCLDLYRRLADIRDGRLPSAGYGEIVIGKVDFTDPFACREVSQGLVLQHANGTLIALILRHWLTWPVESITATSGREDLATTLRQACITNAEKSMRTIGAVRALIDCRYGPLVAPFATSNFFNAAMVFVIPVLRAVKIGVLGDREAEIRALPEWPEEIFPLGLEIAQSANSHQSLPPDDAHPHRGGSTTLPSTIYSDPMIRECANNALCILDGLTMLKASPLGETAERNLALLVQQYGLRDSYNSPPLLSDLLDVDTSANPVSDWAWPTWTGPHESPPPEGDLFDQLMQMDPSIWQGLLDAQPAN